MILTFLSWCFAAEPITLKLLMPESYGNILYRHAQDGANASFKTFNFPGILQLVSQRSTDKDSRVPYVAYLGETPIAAVFFGYWGKGDNKKEHFDVLPFGPETYQHFDGIIVAALQFYNKLNTRLSTLILSFHPERCGTSLTKENFWKIDTGKEDDSTKLWCDPAQRQELALKGIVGPLPEGDQSLPPNVASRAWFYRALTPQQAVASTEAPAA